MEHNVNTSTLREEGPLYMGKFRVQGKCEDV